MFNLIENYIKERLHDELLEQNVFLCQRLFYKGPILIKILFPPIVPDVMNLEQRGTKVGKVVHHLLRSLPLNLNQKNNHSIMMKKLKFLSQVRMQMMMILNPNQNLGLQEVLPKFQKRNRISNMIMNKSTYNLMFQSHLLKLLKKHRRGNFKKN